MWDVYLCLYSQSCYVFYHFEYGNTYNKYRVITGNIFTHIRPLTIYWSVACVLRFRPGLSQVDCPKLSYSSVIHKWDRSLNIHWEIRCIHGISRWNSFQMYFSCPNQLSAVRDLKRRVVETQRIEMSVSLVRKFPFFFLIECKKRSKLPWRPRQDLLSTTL